MPRKLYQVTIDKTQIKRYLDRISMSVTAHDDYAHSKNINHWDDPVAECLSDDLGGHWQHFEDYIKELMNNAKEVQSDNT